MEQTAVELKNTVTEFCAEPNLCNRRGLKKMKLTDVFLSGLCMHPAAPTTLISRLYV